MVITHPACQSKYHDQRQYHQNVGTQPNFHADWQVHLLHSTQVECLKYSAFSPHPGRNAENGEMMDRIETFVHLYSSQGVVDFVDKKVSLPFTDMCKTFSGSAQWEFAQQDTKRTLMFRRQSPSKDKGSYVRPNISRRRQAQSRFYR